MEARINMIGIITNNFDAMRNFYHQTLGFEIAIEMENFVEFKSEGVRFAISTGKVMQEATGKTNYLDEKEGHSFELAFRCQTPNSVDKDYKKLVVKGAKPIKEPTNMPWGQRTAFFADPDNNIHELFCDQKTQVQ